MPHDEDLILLSTRLPGWLLHRIEQARLQQQPLPTKQSWLEYILSEGLTVVEEKNDGK